MLYFRVKAVRIWFFGIGIFVVLLIDLLSMWRILPPFTHFPSLFGVGGGVILGCFLTILWLWMKKYATLEGPAKTAAELQLVGYVFFMIAMWYLCGTHALPYQKALLELPLRSPVAIIVYLVLGWLFLLLSHYKSVQATRK